MIKRKTPLKRSGPIKKKPVSPELKAERKEQHEKDWAMYRRIWASRMHRCAMCNIWLGNEAKSFHFDHLIEKATHPELRYVEETIILICGDDHSAKSVGHPRPKHKWLIEKAKNLLL